MDTDKKFTGQRLDATGLYFYNARYYDATIGRFISADIIIPNPANPQCFDRYSYCLNNPLKFIDPSGYLTGTVVIDGVTYTVVEDQEKEGYHYLVAPDNTVTASVPLADLLGMISDEMARRGDFSYGGNQCLGATVKINVNTNIFSDPIPVFFITEDHIINNVLDYFDNLLGRNFGGITFDFAGGVFIEMSYALTLDPTKLEENIYHECWHYAEETVFGFGPIAYLEYVVELGIVGYDEHSAEKRADKYAETLKVPTWFRIIQGLTGKY